MKQSFFRLSENNKIEWIEQFKKDIVSGNAYRNVYNNEASLLEQLYGLIGQKKTFSTVEDKVKDMQERAGLNIYWQRKANEETIKNINNKPFQRFDEKIRQKIEIFVNNKLKTYYGYLSVLSLQDEILEVFKKDGIELTDIYAPETTAWLKNKIEEEKQKHPHQKENLDFLGKEVSTKSMTNDIENNDFFSSMITKNK